MPPQATPTVPLLPAQFVKRKALILKQLSVPAAQYDDLSPKGSIDEGIKHVIERLNAHEGWVTTSSCAGRVCVFLEGERHVKGGGEAGSGDGRDERGDGHMEDGEGRDKDGMWGHGDEENAGTQMASESMKKLAGVGGKGGGGRWLFVSHESVDVVQITEKGSISSFLGMQNTGEEFPEFSRKFITERLVHFKFEPMILHVLTASLSHAQVILKAALQAGFRESGALNLVSTTSEPPLPMVGVRTTGIILDCIVGRLAGDGVCVSLVTDDYLKGLLDVANQRFEENLKRIERFYDLLLDSAATIGSGGRKQEGIEWEDKLVRKDRLRVEGLKRSQELKDRGNDDI